MEDSRSGDTTFLDEELDFDLDFDEPEASVAVERPRRSLSRKPKDAYRPRRLGTPNWSRIASAAFIAVVVVFVLGFAIKSYLDARKTSAYQDYFSTVGDLTRQSDTQGKQLESMLASPSGADRGQLIAQLERMHNNAEGLLRDARKAEVPEEMADTHVWVETTLEYRAIGIDELERAMATALAADDRAEAAKLVAEANRLLEASDQVWETSYIPGVRRVLENEQVTDVKVPDSNFITDPEFTSVKAVKLTLDRLASPANAADGKKGAGKCAEGQTCGGALGQVTIAPTGEALATSGVTEIASSESLAFTVPFENQGTVQATKVPVTVEITGDNMKAPVKLSGTIDQVDPGQTGTAQIALTEPPLFGEILTVTVTAGPIPGEVNQTNNSARYDVQFTL
jgi:hypothetical protein